MTLSAARRRLALVGAAALSSWTLVWHAEAGSAAPVTTGATCTVVGTAKADSLVGTRGEDVICGLGGNDTISGGGGDDTIDGGAGDDTITGGIGDDTITGGTGNDAMSGGAGSDTVSYADHSAAVTADLDGVRDDGSSGESDLVTVTVENLTGGSGADTLTGSAGANAISGGAGNDVISAGAGNDRVLGGTGNDRITGGAGADSLDGNEGTNVCDKDSADTVLRCPPDRTAPLGRHFQLSTGKVDTSAAAKSVTATVRVTDDFSGVHSVTAKLVGPATYTQAAARRSGTPGDGTWEATFTIPKGAPAGVYALHVGTSDKAGNAQEPRDTSLRLEQSGNGDSTAPHLASWEAKFASAEGGGDTVTVTARLTDAGSGVASASARIVGPATYTATATRTAGTAADGTWTAVIAVPDGAAAAGSYTLVVAATDADGNAMEKEITTAVTIGPADAGGDPATDTTAPFVGSWKVDPSLIDTSSGAEDVAVTARVTDAGSGVAAVVFQLVGPGGTFTRTVTTRASGSAADATYEGVVTVPDGAAAGQYRLYIGAADAAGNVLAPKPTDVVVENDASGGLSHE